MFAMNMIYFICNKILIWKIQTLFVFCLIVIPNKIPNMFIIPYKLIRALIQT